MAVEPSKFAQYRVRQLLLTGAVTVVLLSVSSTIVQLPIREPPPVDPVGELGVLLVAIALVVLASGGIAATWHSRLSSLWLATSGLLLVSVVPLANRTGANVVMSLVLVSVVVSPEHRRGASPEYRWSEMLFGAAMLAATTSTGLLAYHPLPGYVSVMGPVGASLVFGTTVAAVAVTKPAVTQPWNDPTISRLSLSRPPTLRSLSVRLVSTIRSGVATGREWYPVWLTVVIWAAGVCGLHFGGMTYGLYTQFWWWDVMTHSLSGFGVAAVLYLVRPAAFRTSRRLIVFLPAVVIAIGAGFEVYEYLFRGFYEVWSVEYYLQDTIKDMVVNTVGALAFSVLPFFRR